MLVIIQTICCWKKLNPCSQNWAFAWILKQLKLLLHCFYFIAFGIVLYFFCTRAPGIRWFIISHTIQTYKSTLQQYRQGNLNEGWELKTHLINVFSWSYLYQTVYLLMNARLAIIPVPPVPTTHKLSPPYYCNNLSCLLPEVKESIYFWLLKQHVKQAFYSHPGSGNINLAQILRRLSCWSYSRNHGLHKTFMYIMSASVRIVLGDGEFIKLSHVGNISVS